MDVPTLIVLAVIICLAVVLARVYKGDTTTTAAAAVGLVLSIILLFAPNIY